MQPEAFIFDLDGLILDTGVQPTALQQPLGAVVSQ